MNLEGKKAPDFELEGSDAKRHRLKDYNGKTVVLYFYPRDNTPGWHEGSLRLQRLKPRRAKSGRRGSRRQQRQSRVAR